MRIKRDVLPDRGLRVYVDIPDRPLILSETAEHSLIQCIGFRGDEVADEFLPAFLERDVFYSGDLVFSVGGAFRDREHLFFNA